MVMNRKAVLEEVRDVFLLAGAGFIMTASGLTCRTCIESPRDFWVLGSFTALVWVVLWKGNANIPGLITKKISWLVDPVKKFLYNLLLTVVFTFGAIYAMAALYKVLFHVNLDRSAVYSLIVTIVISLFMHGRSFLLNWKESTIAAEKLQRENIAAKYEALKNQVNPHFLFNSFNALSNLVYEDPEKAVKFIKQLSEVYRYVLDTREKEVVSLAEELRFVDSYLYLQRIRFGDKLKVDFSIARNDQSVAPLALQMLLENAIKHNIVSEDEPLRIRVFDHDGYLIVENNLQRKSSLGDESAHVGLDNIIRRYEFLTDQKVQVVENEKNFTVRLPMLNVTTP
jgi:hypothetical protein